MTIKPGNKIGIGRGIIITIFIIMGLWGGSAGAFTLSGTVVDDVDFLPVQSVYVQMYFNGYAIGGASDSTDANGFYLISAVPGETYDIYFDPLPSSGMRPKWIQNFTISSDTTLDVALIVGFFIKGFIRDTLGNGIDCIDLNVYDLNTPDTAQITTTGDDSDSAGFYDVLVPTGTYMVLYRPVLDTLCGNAGPIAPYFPQRVYDVIVDTSDVIINVVLESGYYVSGTVTGPGGVPVVDADLDADDSFTGERLITPGDNTNSAGYYDFLVPPGTYDINVTPLFSDGLVPQIVYGVVVNGPTTLDFTLEFGDVLSGTVLNPAGDGIPDVNLDVLDYNTGLKLFTPHDYTDQSGYFQMILSNGLYNMEIEPPQSVRLSGTLIDSLVFSSDTSIIAQLDTGMYVSGIVTDSTGAGLPDVHLFSFNATTGDFVFASGNKTDSIGFYDIFIPPNTYNLVYKPDSLSGIPDSVILSNVPVFSDTVINVSIIGGTPDTEPPTVSVLTPNGGENWAAYSSQIITWNAVDNVGVSSVDISYSTTGPSGSYMTISNGEINDGYYMWVVPPDTTANAYVKVVAYDISSNSGEDISNAPFSIFGELDTIPPTVSVIAPNGGENWAAFSNQTIVWNANDNTGVSFLDISYSITGPAGPYIAIANGEINDGFYIWTVPSDTTANAYVKIAAYDGSSNSAEDISNAPFTIFTSSSSCNYIMGDVNNSGSLNGLDVVFMVNYFKGGDPPSYVCQCTPGDSWYVAGDVNSSCSFNGLDVTFLVGFFKGGPGPTPCPACPPGQ